MAELYRLPAQSSARAGGVYPTVVMGLTMTFVLSLWAATELVAYRCGFAPALGQPMTVPFHGRVWTIAAFMRNDGYGGEFKTLNRDVIKPAVKEINTVTDFDIKAEYKREKRKVAAVKFRVRRVEQFLGQRPRQRELFLDDKDTPLIVRELKNAGLAAEEAWRIWQEGFKYVEENKRPTNIGENPEAAFDQYVLEKVHLLRRWQKEQKVRNVTGFLREALRKNYANPEFAAEQQKKKAAAGGERQRIEAQKAELKKARDVDIHQLCEKIVQETPALLEEAVEQIFKENALIRKACQREKTPLENYQEKPMLRILVDQYLMTRYPERFLTIRERYDVQLTAIEESAVSRKHASA